MEFKVYDDFSDALLDISNIQEGGYIAVASDESAPEPYTDQSTRYQKSGGRLVFDGFLASGVISYLRKKSTDVFERSLRGKAREIISTLDYVGCVGDGENDDTDAIRRMFQEAATCPGAVVRFMHTGAAGTGQTIYLIKGDIAIPNKIRIESNRGVNVVVGEGSNPGKAAFYSAIYDVPATSSDFQNGKFDLEIDGLRIGYRDGNSSGHGLLLVGDSVILNRVRVSDTPWNGIHVQHRSYDGSEQADGSNMLFHHYSNIIIRNNGKAVRLNPGFDYGKATGLYVGENQGGKITDGWISNISVTTAPRGCYLGSSAGWHCNNIRISNVDDGIYFGQPNRTHVLGLQIDGYGKGFDVEKELFYGLGVGRMLVSRSSFRAIGFTQTEKEAGGEGKTYYGCTVADPQSSNDENTFDIDVSHHMGASSAAVAYGFHLTGDGNLLSKGFVKGVVRGGITGVASVPLGLGLNLDGLVGDEVVRNVYSRSFCVEWSGHRQSIPSGATYTLTEMTYGVPLNGVLEVDVVLGPSNSQGYVNRVGSSRFGVRAHTSGSSPALFSLTALTDGTGMAADSSVEAVPPVSASTGESSAAALVDTNASLQIISKNTADLTVRANRILAAQVSAGSNSAGIRNITEPAISVSSPTLGTLAVSVQASTSGSSDSGFFSCWYRIRFLGRGIYSYSL